MSADTIHTEPPPTIADEVAEANLVAAAVAVGIRESELDGDESVEDSATYPHGGKRHVAEILADALEDLSQQTGMPFNGRAFVNAACGREVYP